MGFRPEKKLTTYGKQRKKFLPNENTAPRPASTSDSVPSLLPSTLPKAEQIVTRQPQASGEKTRPRPQVARQRAKPTNTEVIESLGTVRAAATPLQPSQDAPRTAIKRKPSQGQTPTRQNKKHRSSSPEPPQKPPAPAQAVRALAKSTPHRSPTPPRDMAIDDPYDMPFSPETTKTLDNLRVSRKSLTLPRREIPLRPTSSSQAKYGSAFSQTSTEGPRRPRQRLIDVLATQADASSEEDEDEARMDEPQKTRATPPIELPHPMALSPNPATPEPSRTRVYSRQAAVTTRKPGVKFTYSQQRTVLAEDPTDRLAEERWMSQPLLPTSQSTLSAFSMEEDTEDGSQPGAIRSVHELRQAGANSRFADELDDILDRVGSPSAPSVKPSSQRRGALLELSEKLRDKAFQGQFRNHSGEESLFRDLRREKDVISGCILGCILVTILAGSPSGHLMPHFEAQGLSELFAMLLAVDVDITTLAKERKSNVSRHGQSSLADLKVFVLQLPLWTTPQAVPSELSPRTVALKALLLVADQSRTGVVSPAVTEQLFAILSSASKPDAVQPWDFPAQDEALDLHAALSLLETQSVYIMQSKLSSEWTSRYLDVVAETLEKSLRLRGDRFGHLDCLALRLTLNTANNNADAQRVYIDKGLLQDLVEAACGTFDTVLQSISSDDFLSVTLDALLLMLGILINFSEQDASVCAPLVRQDLGSSPLDRLIKLFLGYRPTTAEVRLDDGTGAQHETVMLTWLQADSVEKSQLNVAFGYLSVLLGYLCLYEPIRKRFVELHPGGLSPLLSSIREFIAYHKVADYAAEAAQAESSSFTGRLQSLVDQLRLA